MFRNLRSSFTVLQPQQSLLRVPCLRLPNKPAAQFPVSGVYGWASQRTDGSCRELPEPSTRSVRGASQKPRVLQNWPEGTQNGVTS